MLVVLIVIPAIVLAVAIVVVLDRLGVLPQMDTDSSGSGWGASSGSGLLGSVPKAGLWGAGVVMALWILAWLLFLVVGLSVLAG